MLRHLKDDIKNKSYAHRASEIVRRDEDLLLKVKNLLGKNKKTAGDSIRSVLRSRNTIVIRARSRTAASELFTLKELILKAARDEGVSAVRFMV
ncbi:MAG: hypothetical protein UY71_C0005G0011 [Parcubacteria group bacterium GW2011_GWB1_52_7]|nr:MAG: hypothetical protein UY64_C0012G0015 [Parcubacteria group bacterium GW2011_GWA1_51_12]KKW29042.1 MAG: hypothetical protein UY71_C0005G0011 [Parcubacteria group bacterium GW2011_GWB1_52_7]